LHSNLLDNLSVHLKYNEHTQESYCFFLF
jgi:hypothetical protein